MTAPLSGARIVVTRPEHQAVALGAELAALGADVIYLPVIAIAPPSDPEGLRAARRRLSEGAYAWALFTSANAIEAVLGRDGAAAVAPRTRIGAVGRATRSALESARVAVDLVPATETAVDLARALGPGAGRVLLPRVEGAPRAMVSALAGQGWTVDEVAAYRNVSAPPSEASARVAAGSFDVVTFLSGSAARSFVALVRDPGALGLAPGPTSTRIVACIGPETAHAARRAGLRVDVVARDRSARGLARVLADRVSADGTMGR